MNKNNHHYMGIEMNIQTWGLLDKKDRSEKDNNRMINFAKASLYHWKKSDKYEVANEQRGQWLMSHVYAKLNKSDEALSYAKETLKITEENKKKMKDFDLAYAYESMARAYSISGDKDKSEKWYKKARDTEDLITGEKDKEYFEKAKARIEVISGNR